MITSKAVIRNLLNANSCRTCYPNSPILVSIVQKNSRTLHTFRRVPQPLLSSKEVPDLFAKWQNNRVLGYLVISRNESSATTSKIPPLSSEVFSKQVEQPASAASQSSNVVTTAPEVPVVNSSAVNSSIGPESSSVVEAMAVAEPNPQLVWENIPEPPVIPSPVEELVTSTLGVTGEPTFASIGLGGWYPSGIVQQCLEYAHVNIGLPWWGAILLGTVCVRLLVFPLVIKSQRNAAKMANNMPQLQAIQLKMSEARQTGNALMAAKYGQDMMLFMKEKDISPFKSMLVPLAMAPIFISFFFGLRKMANLPVDSMRVGGLWWFTDLTLADPFFLLPLMTSVTLWITMEVGVDGVQLSASQHGNVMRYVMRAIPVIMFPLTMNFPAAILCYWVSTNAISLVQVSLLKLPAIRTALNIEPLRKFQPGTLPIQKKGFIDSVKDSWTNVKISKEMEDRVRYDEISFKRAGRGPIPKTYKYDPTKAETNAIQAKQKQ